MGTAAAGEGVTFTGTGLQRAQPALHCSISIHAGPALSGSLFFVCRSWLLRAAGRGRALVRRCAALRGTARRGQAAAGARCAASSRRRGPRSPGAPSSVNQLCFGECRPRRMQADPASCSPGSRHTLQCFLDSDRAPGASAMCCLGSAQLGAPAGAGCQQLGGSPHLSTQQRLPLVQSSPCWSWSASRALG